MFRILYDEDTIFGDVTSELLIPSSLRAIGTVIAKENCVIAGVRYLKGELESLDLDVEIVIDDDEEARDGDAVISIKGPARRILSVERTLLNFLGRMSGIATETRRIVSLVREVNPHVRIAATRKTLWGHLDKIAVRIGGGDEHRVNLGDMILVKDNHIALVGFDEVKRSLSRRSFTKKVEIEAESEEMALEAAEIADIVMLDNLAPEEACRIAKKIKERYDVLVEFSGGINPDNVVDYARCPHVDVISMGYLTHSARSINFSLEVSVEG